MSSNDFGEVLRERAEQASAERQARLDKQITEERSQREIAEYEAYLNKQREELVAPVAQQMREDARLAAVVLKDQGVEPSGEMKFVKEVLDDRWVARSLLTFLFVKARDEFQESSIGVWWILNRNERTESVQYLDKESNTDVKGYHITRAGIAMTTDGGLWEYKEGVKLPFGYKISPEDQDRIRSGGLVFPGTWHPASGRGLVTASELDPAVPVSEQECVASFRSRLIGLI